MKDVVLRVIQSWLKKARRGACAAGDSDGADLEQHPQVGVVSVGPGMEFRRLGSRGVQSVREA